MSKEIIKLQETFTSKFMIKYDARVRLARTEGETERDVIKEQRLRLDEIEQKDSKLIPQLSAIRISLGTKEEILKNSNLTKDEATAIAQSNEITRLKTIIKNEPYDNRKKELYFFQLKTLSSYINADREILIHTLSQQTPQKPSPVISRRDPLEPSIL